MQLYCHGGGTCHVIFVCRHILFQPPLLRTVVTWIVIAFYREYLRLYRESIVYSVVLTNPEFYMVSGVGSFGKFNEHSVVSNPRVGEVQLQSIGRMAEMDPALQVLSTSVRRCQESQVNTLVYSMGDKADDILHSFHLSEADLKKVWNRESKIRSTLRQKPKHDFRASEIQQPQAGRRRVSR